MQWCGCRDRFCPKCAKPPIIPVWISFGFSKTFQSCPKADSNISKS
jgi:hypothetical protein